MARHAIHLQREIDLLKKKILSLGAEVEESVRRSVRALATRDSALAMLVIDQDSEIDQQEVDVEEECLKILALHQPVANDLRLIIAILKINNDLERIADLSVNIAERTVYLATQDKIAIPFDFPGMADKVQSMLQRSLDALVNADSALARQVCADDDEVDRMNREVYGRVEAAIRERPEQINGLINLLSASRYLERAADHATNIAEDVIYLVEGVIIRHQGPNRENSPNPSG
jgi:phosphate transport system protein